MTAKSLDAILNEFRAGRSNPFAEPAHNLGKLADRSLLVLYENIRHQVAADVAVRPEYRLVGEAAKQRALLLQGEMVRRGLPFDPIIWP